MKKKDKLFINSAKDKKERGSKRVMEKNQKEKNGIKQSTTGSFVIELSEIKMFYLKIPRSK